MNELDTQLEEQNTVEVEEMQEETKTFTQEDVNKIVERRLARERSRLSSLFNDPRETEISKKEKELNIKETSLEMKKHLLDNNKNLDLMKLVDLSNGTEKAMESLANIEKVLNDLVVAEVEKRVRGTEPPLKKAPAQVSEEEINQIRKEMGLS